MGLTKDGHGKCELNSRERSRGEEAVIVACCTFTAEASTNNVLAARAVNQGLRDRFAIPPKSISIYTLLHSHTPHHTHMLSASPAATSAFSHLYLDVSTLPSWARRSPTTLLVVQFSFIIFIQPVISGILAALSFRPPISARSFLDCPHHVSAPVTLT